MSVPPELLVDGKSASAADLTHLALANYGAYTSFRVEEGAVRGLDRHLARLEVAAIELFGDDVGEPRLRELMRYAVGGRDECWLRVSLFSSGLTARSPDWQGVPRVLTAVSASPAPLARTLRLQVQTYAREAAHLKHAATFGLIRARRAARAAGFDDALFVYPDGRVSEGSLWNIGLVRGEQVTWPQAPMLAGVTQALLQNGLEGVGLTGIAEPIGRTDLDRFDGAFICNSATPACAVSGIGERKLATSPELIERLVTAWASNPAQPI